MIQGLVARAAISAIGRSGMSRLGGKLIRTGKNLPLPDGIIDEKHDESHGKKNKKNRNYSKDDAGFREHVLDPLIEKLKGEKDKEDDDKKIKTGKMTALLAHKLLHKMFGGKLKDGGKTVFHLKPVSGYEPIMNNKMSLKKK